MNPTGNADTTAPPRPQCTTCGFWREDPTGAARCIRRECVRGAHAESVGEVDRVCFYTGCDRPLADDGPDGHPDGLCIAHRLALADGDPKAIRAVAAFAELKPALPPRRRATYRRVPTTGCSTPGCQGRHLAKGLCKRCYRREQARRRRAAEAVRKEGGSNKTFERPG